MTSGVSDLAISLAWALAPALAGVVLGLHLGRKQGMRLMERRATVALAHVQAQHRTHLKDIRTMLVKQAEELNDARLEVRRKTAAAEQLARALAERKPKVPLRAESNVLQSSVPTLPLSQAMPDTGSAQKRLMTGADR